MEITDFFPTYIKLWRYCKCAMVLEINIYLCEPMNYLLMPNKETNKTIRLFCIFLRVFCFSCLPSLNIAFTRKKPIVAIMDQSPKY